MIRSIALSTLLVLLASLHGCISTTRIETTFAAPAETAATSLLLAGRTVEQQFQQRWESRCQQELAAGNLQITLLHRASPNSAMPSASELSELAQQLGVDAVLSIELTALLLAAPQMPPDNIVSVERQPGMAAATVASYDIMLRGSQSTPQPLPDEQQIPAQFDRADGHTLWRGTLISHEANEIDAMARSQCRSLKKILRQLQLI